MDRDKAIESIAGYRGYWDVIVIGGGATGLGIAVDAQTRGYRTLLLEQYDFAKGTSSRSTKLVHGGVRYLQQGNVALVLEALRERGLLCRNAPHLVHDLAVRRAALPWWEGPFYGVGLKLYDVLAGKLNIARSRRSQPQGDDRAHPERRDREPARRRRCTTTRSSTTRAWRSRWRRPRPTTARVLVNYMPVTGLMKTRRRDRRRARGDVETGARLRAARRGGDQRHRRLRRRRAPLDDRRREPMVAPSQGVHLVLDRSFQPSDTAIMVPQTDDGRVLFVIPWHERVLVGTTDTAVPTRRHRAAAAAPRRSTSSCATPRATWRTTRRASRRAERRSPACVRWCSRTAARADQVDLARALGA